MEVISWRDMKINEDVLKVVQEERRSLMDVIDLQKEEKLNRLYTQR